MLHHPCSSIYFSIVSFVTILSAKRTEAATIVSVGLLLIGLFTNDFLPAFSGIGTLSIGLTALLHTVGHRHIVQKKHWRVYSALTGVFFLHVVAGLNTSEANREEYWVDIFQQLPFLVLPAAFWLLPPLSSLALQRLYLLFYYLVVASALGSTGYYLMHRAEIDQLYYQSQIIPTVPDYIRFSLMVTFAIAIGSLFLINQAIAGRHRLLVLLTTIFLILYLYLLAVRSGLVAFNALGLVVIGWSWQTRHYKWALGAGGMLLILPLMSFICFPTFHNKYYNTQDDVSRVEKAGSANNFSLVGRVYSYKVGLQIAQAHPLIGVGKADMEDEVAVYYQDDFPAIEPTAYLLPHNQFLYYLVAFGGLGLFVFNVCFYYPLYWSWPNIAPLLIAQYIIISLSFLVEYTLDQKNQVGLLFTLLFLLMPINGLMLPTRQEVDWRPS
ncbi:O-antigen polymerase [Hymenobacter roseosalivarius DSM 11622]|uniref:O-antigen polymerase n=1 Tax=Hymenobacter roseosalivarius DSM 11622 TaxID=645990 RepID=A0A1W1VTX4_9BACT|nr:O-antigen ligase family protein [Hymenobacter roseosalivarius]SMB96344.1 O-antigen polymerase [Hymenobacter roseosalivarius DSM 11622]